MREPTPFYTNRLQCVECGRVAQENERGLDGPAHRRRRGSCLLPMAFLYKLEHEDGTPVDPPTLHTRGSELACRHTIHSHAGRSASSR